MSLNGNLNENLKQDLIRKLCSSDESTDGAESGKAPDCRNAAEAQQDRLEQIFRFCLEIDKEKRIQRVTTLAGNDRREDDAEHAWHMAVMTLLLSEYANEDIDVLHTVSMALIHDLIEIYAGDTYAYDAEGKKSQRVREEAAADRLFGMLPDDLRDKFRGLFEEFDANETKEARFAHVMDNIQPMMLNAANHGQSWKDHGIRLSQVLHRNRLTASGSETIWEYAFEHFMQPSLESGCLKKDVDYKIGDLIE